MVVRALGLLLVAVRALEPLPVGFHSTAVGPCCQIHLPYANILNYRIRGLSS